MNDPAHLNGVRPAVAAVADEFEVLERVGATVGERESMVYLEPEG